MTDLGGVNPKWKGILHPSADLRTEQDTGFADCLDSAFIEFIPGEGSVIC